ncbi:MAG: YraN family protein [Lachnospiraceae bacterium]
MGRKGNTSRLWGAGYEKLAAEYLSRKGYHILHTNFTIRGGEIDIIARQGRYLVFVEVKYRKDTKGGHPLEAVTIQKQKRICRTASFYCLRYGYEMETPCRFDVIGILGKEIIHIEDAFSYEVG